MSHPRMSVPGGTYLVTRTTAMSLFLLAPGKVVNGIMEYCLALALRGRKIKLHAISVESNHFHMVVTDMDGQMSEFMQEFNRCTGRCLLPYYRARYPKTRIDSLWSGAQSYTCDLLLTQRAILRELVYTYTNPVKDGLVRDYRKWPGFNTRPGQWREGPCTARRPDFYLKNTPEKLQYEIVAPSQLEGQLDRVIGDVEHHILEAQGQAAIEVADAGRSFLGAKAARRISPLDAPTTARPHGNLNPHLASGGDGAAMVAAKVALKTFRLAYREAWKAFTRGADAVFPGGTLMMRKRYGVELYPP